MAKASDYPAIGSRIELPVHYNLWARGARFGTVTSFRHGKPGQSDYVTVKMDHPQVRRRVKLWRGDWAYARTIPLAAPVFASPHDALRWHVSGAIERGETQAIAGIDA